MTVLMKLTVGALWLTAGATRRDLSSAAYLSRVDPHRTFAPAPRDAGAFGRLTEDAIGGSTVLRWQPHDHISGRELIYLPGGGFVNPLVSQHWWIIQRIMTTTQAAITIAPYPLTPERTVDDAQTFIDAVYDDVAGRPGTTSLFVAGDSAGGNVAATLALRVRDGDRRPLDGLILLSPWVDPTMCTPGAWQRERRDRTLRCAGLRAAAEAWSGTHDLHDPQISPIDDSLAALAPLIVFQGARRLPRRCGGGRGEGPRRRHFRARRGRRGRVPCLSGGVLDSRGAKHTNSSAASSPTRSVSWADAHRQEYPRWDSNPH